MTCGSIISDNHQLQNEVSFGENAQGAAVVQGTTLQEGQRRTHIPGLGHQGAEAPDRDDRLRTANAIGNEAIDRIGKYELKLPESVIVRAYNLYSLAKLHAFQRPVSENAAIAIYTACREMQNNEILLIDLAELIHVNVFELGAAYKKFLERIDLKDKYMGTNPEATFQRMVEPEPLIKRFASRLEFGKDKDKVAADACSILKRMKRDWMVTGRQPMGLVGACLIIAARMNNYRRTLREVVYVVRAGEMTILKRLNEFSSTAAARLTVDQFRQLRDDEALHSTIKQALPPSLANPRPRKKRKTAHNDDVASSRATSLAPSEATDITDASEAELRRDADGFAIPALPPRARSKSINGTSPPPAIDPELGGDDKENDNEDEEQQEEEEHPRKRGRPKKLPLPEVNVTADDLEAEEVIEADIAANVEAIESSSSIAEERGEGWFRAKALADAARAEDEKKSKWKLSSLDLDSEEIDEDEFEDDNEVKFCKLTEREVEVKERIWVSHNHDWMRAQQERLLQEQLASARGKKKRAGPRRKMKRRGDGSVLEGSPVRSAADASSKMMEARSKRHKYSRHVDYAVLNRIYQDEDTASSRASTPASRRSSVTPAPSRSVTPSPSKKAAGRRVSFSSDVGGDGPRSPSVAPSVASSTGAGAQQSPPPTSPTFEAEGGEEEYEDEDDDEDPLPGFGEDDYGEEYVVDDDEDYMDVAKDYGMDIGDR